MDIENSIVDCLKKAVKKEFNLHINPQVFKNKNIARGDYYSQITLIIAPKLNKSPYELAVVLQSLVSSNKLFSNIVVTQNGFINFFINKNYISSAVLQNALTKFNVKADKTKKYIVEHTSVNPNKAMHIGHIRNAVFGSTIVNILKHQGKNVEVHNYIDDTGLQVADTTNALLNLNISQKSNQSFENYCWDIYTQINNEYKNNNYLEQREKIVHQIESLTGATYKLSVKIVNKIVKAQLQLMSQFNIYYDLLVYESDIIYFGFWEESFKKLKKSPNFFLQTKGKQKGCYVLKSDTPNVEDKIFVRKNGTKVYTAKDTAYHLWKFGKLKSNFKYKKYEQNSYKTDKKGIQNTTFGRGTVVITLTDERQSFALNAVKQALKSTGYVNEANNMHHIAYGVVSLSLNTAKALGVDTSDNKSFYQMSGRGGIGVKVTDLLNLLCTKIEEIQKENKVTTIKDDINNIAVAAIKHYILKYNPLSPIVFDYNQALQINGNTGPYLLYSYVRALNILNKATKYKKLTNYANLTKNEQDLIIKISEWQAVINSIDFTFNTSKIADYAFNLSKSFHSFYEKDKVLSSTGNTKNFRLTLVLAYKNTLEQIFNVMGIKPVNKM